MLFVRSEAGALGSLGDRLADSSKRLGGGSVPIVELAAQLACLSIEDPATMPELGTQTCASVNASRTLLEPVVRRLVAAPEDLCNSFWRDRC
jgi:hypothetical protein